MMNPRNTLSTAEQALWEQRLDQLPARQRYLTLTGRMLFALVRDFNQGLLSLQAMSLVYTTLLSLVPLLAVSFSVLKGFGVHNQLEPWLLRALSPLGDKGATIASNLIGFVDNTNVGVLGSVGLGLLLYSVISLIQKIEQVFNSAWRVKQIRPIAERFSHYLSVLLIGPVLFFSAVGATASLRSSTLVQWLLDQNLVGFVFTAVVPWLLPYLLITLAFTFIYAFVPNTHVKLGAALIGALVAGLLWQLVGLVFADFMAGSTKYAAIYSSLAILILFMMWVYIAWLLVLIGANIAFYVQNPEYLNTRVRDPRLSNRMRERLALSLLGRIVSDYVQGHEPPDAEALAKDCGVPGTNMATLLEILTGANLIRCVRANHGGYVPARPPEQMPIRAVLEAVRHYEEDRPPEPAHEPIRGIEERLSSALHEAVEGLTLADLASSSQGSQE